jgi:hypothetical protein
MPLEIQEIAIGMHVSKAAGAGGPVDERKRHAAAAKLEMDAIVRKCVQQVLQALAEAKGR